MAANPSYTLRTLRKGLAVLEAFADSETTLSLTELSARLEESPTVVFRILKTLEEHGYAEQDPESKRYTLGLRIWEIGNRALSRFGFTEAVRPTLERLTEQTGETSSVAVPRGIELLYVAVVEGLDPLHVYLEPGSRAPLYLTASGKAILAFSSPDLFEAVVAAGLRRRTPATITTASRLRARLEEIRQSRLSVVHGERQLHLSAVAAPILHTDGRCIGAVAVSGLSPHFTDDRLPRISEAVTRAASEIATKVSGGDSTPRLVRPARGAKRRLAGV